MGNSQPIQIANNADIRRRTVWRAYFGEKTKGVAEQCFASALEGTKGHRKQSHQELFQGISHVLLIPLATWAEGSEGDEIVWEGPAEKPLVKWSESS